MAARQQNWNEWWDISCPVPIDEWPRGTARSKKMLRWKRRPDAMLATAIQRLSKCPRLHIGQVLFPFRFIVYGARYNNQVHLNGQKQIDVISPPYWPCLNQTSLSFGKKKSLYAIQDTIWIFLQIHLDQGQRLAGRIATSHDPIGFRCT